MNSDFGGPRLRHIIVLAVGLRIIIIAASLYAGDISLKEYAMLHDGYEYHHYASAIARGSLGSLPSETTRFYPGYPLLLALFRFWWMQLLIPVAAAAGVVLLSARIFQDSWIAAYLGVFTPSWVLYTSVNMSEGLFLLCMLAGLWCFLESRPIGAGLLWGYGCLVRPVGVLLLGAALFHMVLVSRERREALWVGGIPLLLLAGWILVSRMTWGDAFKNVSEYRVVLSYPMRSMAEGLFSESFSFLKKAYIYANLAMVVAALILIFKDGIVFSDRLYMINMLWLIFSVAAYSIIYENRGWLTFEIYDRMVISFLPPILYALRPVLPRRRWALWTAAAVSAGLVIYWNHNLIHAWRLPGHLFFRLGMR